MLATQLKLSLPWIHIASSSLHRKYGNELDIFYKYYRDLKVPDRLQNFKHKDLCQKLSYNVFYDIWVVVYVGDKTNLPIK